jgi:RNase H-like domain found in reverse transcriptase
LENKLRVKRNNCEFGVKQIEYLEHLISGQGVVIDPEKIKAMMEWSVPKSVKELRGFLGLTGYYRKFIKFYGHLSKPLTELLKKNAFKWGAEANTAFLELKHVMCRALVLAMPNFEEPFFIEMDASNKDMGADHSLAKH